MNAGGKVIIDNHMLGENETIKIIIAVTISHVTTLNMAGASK